MNTNMNANNGERQRSTSRQRFSWWFAGADIRLLEMCPSEWHRFTALGIFVLIVGLLSIISGTVFLTTALGIPLYLALLGGIFWGGVIVGVDRVLLTHFDKSKGQFWRAVPRILMSIVISIVVSHPLLLKMFEGEIDAHLHQKKAARLQNVRGSSDKQAAKTRLDADFKKAQDRLDRLQQVKEDAEREMNLERGGIKSNRTTGRLGEGSVYELKKKIFDDASANLERERPGLEAQINDLRSQIDAAQSGIDSEVNEVNDKETKAAGVLNRQKALNEIIAQDYSVALHAICIYLLLLGIETLPITQKLLSRRRRYDMLVEKETTSAEGEIDTLWRRTDEQRQRDLETERAIMERVNNTAASGDMGGLNNTKERELAEQIHLNVIRRHRSRLRSTPGKNGASLGLPITVQVEGHPDITAQLAIPEQLESAVTLESLGPQLAQIEREVQKDVMSVVSLDSATNSDGEEVDRVFLPLLQQLNEDRTLHLKYLAVRETDTTA